MESNILFTIDQKSLYKSMERIKTFREGKPIVPYANHIYFSSTGQDITFMASDIENIASLSLEGIKSIEKSFEMCVENTFILPLMAREVDISFEIGNNTCIIHSPNGKVTVPTLPPENYPKIDDADEHLFDIKERALLEILSTIIPFTHNEPIYSNNSLHFVYDGNSLRIGASDNFSSCSTSVQPELPTDIQRTNEFNFMISSKSVNMVIGVLQKNSEEICRVLRKHHDIIFKTSLGLISCREMTFSDMAVANDFYRLSMKYVSREADIIYIEDKKLLIEQLQKAMVFSDPSNFKVIINLQRNKIVLEAEDLMIGRKSIQEMFVKFKHEGETKRIIVNAKYFLKMLRNINNEIFEIRLPLNNGVGVDCISDPMTVDFGGFIYVLASLS